MYGWRSLGSKEGLSSYGESMNYREHRVAWMERQVTSHLQHIIAWLENDNYEFNDEQVELLEKVVVLAYEPEET